MSTPTYASENATEKSNLMSPEGPQRPWQRGLSLLELGVGTAIVIGHNVYHVVPNEVPILFVIGLLSLRLRGGSWAATGLRWPASWRRTAGMALAAAAARILLGSLVIQPLTAHFWPAAAAPRGSDEIQGNAIVAFEWLLLIWTFAAFGEEIGYRGYLLTRAAEVGGRSKAAYWVANFIVAILFGYGHFYKGPAGMLDSGIAGLILGTAYILSKRNLWVCILAHGFIDTVAVVVAFLGFES